MTIAGAGEASSLNMGVAIAIIIVCIFLSSFFAGSETALTAASRPRMHALEKSGDKRAALVNRLLRSRDRFIGAMLMGNTMANIASSAVATSLLIDLFGETGAIYATFLMTAILLIFAEVLPKTIAINFPDQISLSVARLVAFWVVIFSPVLVAIEAMVNGLFTLFGIRKDHGYSLTDGHNELKSAVSLLHQEGGVARDDRDMVGGLLDLQALSVSDVMVHRTNMATINADLPLSEIIQAVIASPYTRLPLWREDSENIIGVLHAKDLLRALENMTYQKNFNIATIIREAWFVPDTTSVAQQLKAFRERKTHFALVVDEYGVVLGLVTLEDILEEIVGDITDEHDIVIQGIRTLPDGSVIVDGALPVRDLNRVMDWSLPDDEATTVAGLVIHEAQTIPEAGQQFIFHGFRFEVLRKFRNRITSLRISSAA